MTSEVDSALPETRDGISTGQDDLSVPSAKASTEKSSIVGAITGLKLCGLGVDVTKDEEKVSDDGGLRKVGLCYDEFCKKHLEGVTHIEAPDRISSIYNHIKKQDTFKHFVEVKTREATKEEIAWCHDQKLIDRLWKIPSEFESRSDPQWYGRFNPDCPYTKDTLKALRLSCGGLLEMTDKVCAGELESGCCVLRPPGHHAECHKCMGFCYVNNVAVAAELAKRKHGLKRICIFDWDVHWGNATQRMFYKDPSVLYISPHRYDNGYFYPGDKAAGEDHIGEGEGVGYNMNIPLFNGFGDRHYMAFMDHLVIPVLKEWNPELIIISAGFDSAMGDPLGGMFVTEPGYGYMADRLKEVCPKVVMCLEGGYNIEVIPKMYYAAALSLQSKRPRHPTRDAYLKESKSIYEPGQLKDAQERRTVSRLTSLQQLLADKGPWKCMKAFEKPTDFSKALGNDFYAPGSANDMRGRENAEPKSKTPPPPVRAPLPAHLPAVFK